MLKDGQFRSSDPACSFSSYFEEEKIYFFLVYSVSSSLKIWGRGAKRQFVLL